MALIGIKKQVVMSKISLATKISSGDCIVPVLELNKSIVSRILFFKTIKVKLLQLEF